MTTKNQELLSLETALLTCNSLMRSELTAAETYRQARQRLGEDAPEEFTTCLQSHDRRATQLAEHITLAGGTPLSGSDHWDAFTRLVASSAERMQPQALYRTLKDGEDQVLTDYRAAPFNLDDSAYLLLCKQLLPEQIRTLALISALCY